MTREEAIHIIEKDIQIDVRSCTNEEVYVFITALNMAIATLREQESAENAHCNCCKKETVGSAWRRDCRRLGVRFWSAPQKRRCPKLVFTMADGMDLVGAG